MLGICTYIRVIQWIFRFFTFVLATKKRFLLSDEVFHRADYLRHAVARAETEISELKTTNMVSLPPEKGTLIPEIYSSLGLNVQGQVASETPRVLALVSSHLERTVRGNETLLEAVKKKQAISTFHGSRVPGVSIRRYIERIFRYAKCSPSCLVLAHIYIDRFLQQPSVHLTCLNVHRLLITGVTVAAKFTDDAFFSNAYYAKVGGISTAELNKMEISFLFGLDFRLQVSTQTFGRYCLRLERDAVPGGCQIERPIRPCGLNGWKSNDLPEGGKSKLMFRVAK